MSRSVFRAGALAPRGRLQRPLLRRGREPCAGSCPSSATWSCTARPIAATAIHPDSLARQPASRATLEQTYADARHRLRTHPDVPLWAKALLPAVKRTTAVASRPPWTGSEQRRVLAGRAGADVGRDPPAVDRDRQAELHVVAAVAQRGELRLHVLHARAGARGGGVQQLLDLLDRPPPATGPGAACGGSRRAAGTSRGTCAGTGCRGARRARGRSRARSARAPPRPRRASARRRHGRPARPAATGCPAPRGPP